jgi:STE24 endopeptidase
MFNTGFGQSFHAQSPQTFAVYAFLFLNMLVTLFFQPLILSVSRKQELEADLFAAKHLGGHQMTRALSKISTSNLGWLPSHPLYEMWYLTHPPICERIKALDNVS